PATDADHRHGLPLPLPPAPQHHHHHHRRGHPLLRLQRGRAAGRARDLAELGRRPVDGCRLPAAHRLRPALACRPRAYPEHRLRIHLPTPPAQHHPLDSNPGPRRTHPHTPEHRRQHTPPAGPGDHRHASTAQPPADSSTHSHTTTPSSPLHRQPRRHTRIRKNEAHLDHPPATHQPRRDRRLPRDPRAAHRRPRGGPAGDHRPDQHPHPQRIHQSRPGTPAHRPDRAPLVPGRWRPAGRAPGAHRPHRRPAPDDGHARRPGVISGGRARPAARRAAWTR
ncbi:hypothetical protein PTTG_12266, partial [Puccinia triticina 1-1 BBBD Race 1]